jgi:phage baseplate assembly protein W
MSGLTPKLPLVKSGEDGTYRLIKTYKDLIKQNFTNLVLTAPGERMMDPHFGVGLRNFLFQNDGQILHSALEAKIGEQVAKYIPFIEIVAIDFGSYDEASNQLDRNSLMITLSYFIGPLGEVDKLEITVPHN